MELRHLRYFVAVAGTLNFSRAAQRMRVAQPALSRQIQDLEQELGFKLFERTTTQVRLTEAGGYLQQQAEKLLFQLDLAVTGATRVAQASRLNFRIGTDWNASALPLAAAARGLIEDQANLTVDFVELPGHEHAYAVREGTIDVGFVPGQGKVPSADLDYGFIHRCAVKAVCHETNRLADRPCVRLRDLKEERFVALDDKEVPGFKTLMRQIVRPAQFVPKFGRTASSFPGGLALIGTGEGIALIPELFLPAAPAGIRYLPTDCEPFELYAVWSKVKPPACLPAFLELLRAKLAAAPLPRPARRGRGRNKDPPAAADLCLTGISSVSPKSFRTFRAGGILSACPSCGPLQNRRESGRCAQPRPTRTSRRGRAPARPRPKRRPSTGGC
jgi:DNA-binding transcriptional LysR family regulator